MTYALGFDALDLPVVVYHRYDHAGRSQAYIARPGKPNTPWEITQISAWDFRWDFSGWSSIAAEVNLSRPVLTADRRHLLVEFKTTHTPSSGRIKLDSATLAPIKTLPPAEPALPRAIQYPSSNYTGIEPRTVVNRDQSRIWVLRWETLPRNRDKARSQVPPPASLVLYEVGSSLPDSVSTAQSDS
jgi:hypothetical protein